MNWSAESKLLPRLELGKMIFGVALANISHKLDILKNDQSISSHGKLKEEGLSCLRALVEEAPASEYLKFLNSKDHGILLAYTLNILCHYSKNDISKPTRTCSLETMIVLLNRLQDLHGKSENCSTRPIVSALPGVSSTLFQVVMSDTKLPRSLLVVAIRNLSKLVTITFLPCIHEPRPSKDTCENLAIRFNFLINYCTHNAKELPGEVLVEVLDLCRSIISASNELLSESISSIVKYIAFMSAGVSTSEVKLKLMIIIDSVKEKVLNSELESVIIYGIFKVLDDLDGSASRSELAILSGFLRLMPGESLTALLEIEDRRKQILNLLIQLTEFSTDQPFFLLTDNEVKGDAIQLSNSKIYSVEKRFRHIASDEISFVGQICQIIGSITDWLLLNDMISNDLRKFSHASNLYITHLILQGLLQRDMNSKYLRSILRFTAGTLMYYIDSIREVDLEDTLVIVIAIETIVTLVELNAKYVAEKSFKIIILKDLLCPLLRLASSPSRAVSEAALSALTQISQLYEYDSTKSLIEDNIDYVVNDVMQMLENFSNNCDVTHVLAITFKLSSKNGFYYFKDVFERLFRVLAIYQHSEKAQLILLLFHRTLATLIDWNQASSKTITGSPLENEEILKQVLYELNIERRASDLAKKSENVELYQQALNKTSNTQENEAKVIEYIKSGKFPEYMKDDDEPTVAEENQYEDAKRTKKPTDEIILTEKILTHCVSMISSDYPEVKILALKTAALGFEILHNDENTLLPLVHKIWAPLEKRLVGDYAQNLEVSLCAFECLVSMAENAKDFIKRRTLDSIIPRICLFLESQAKESSEEKDYGPYGMTVAYKCQLKILTHLGALAYHIELAYSNLWRVVRTTLLYLNASQMESLRRASRISLHYMMALDADCVWYYSRQTNFQAEDHLPFHLIFELAP